MFGVSSILHVVVVVVAEASGMLAGTAMACCCSMIRILRPQDYRSIVFTLLC